MICDPFTIPLGERPAHAVVIAKIAAQPGLRFGLQMAGREPVSFELGRGGKGEISVRYDLALQQKNGRAVVAFTESIVSGPTTITRHGCLELPLLPGPELEAEFFCTIPRARLQFCAVS